MQPTISDLLGVGRSLFSAVRAGHTSHSSVGWVLTLAALLALVAVGGVAARVAHRLVRRSTPELSVLLDQSAAFYGRWPEDLLADAPRGDLAAEAARCQRIIELLERRTAVGIDDGPATRGRIDGLRSWIALLYRRIEVRSDTRSGATYA